MATSPRKQSGSGGGAALEPLAGDWAACARRGRAGKARAAGRGAATHTLVSDFPLRATRLWRFVAAAPGNACTHVPNSAAYQNTKRPQPSPRSVRFHGRLLSTDVQCPPKVPKTIRCFVARTAARRLASRAPERAGTVPCTASCREDGSIASRVLSHPGVPGPTRPQPLPPCHAPGVCPRRCGGGRLCGAEGVTAPSLPFCQRVTRACRNHCPASRGQHLTGRHHLPGDAGLRCEAAPGTWETGVGRCHIACHQPASGRPPVYIFLRCPVHKGCPPSSAPHGTGWLASWGLHATFCTYLTSSNRFQNPVPVGDFLQRPLHSLKEQEAISF